MRTVTASRKEVVDLRKWLQFTMHSIDGKQKAGQKGKGGADSREEEVSFRRKIQTIYAACLNELILQSKSICSERGELFEQIWVAYIHFTRDIIIAMRKERVQLIFQQEFLLSQKDLNHIQSIKKYEIRIEKKSKQISELQDRVLSWKTEASYSKKKYTLLNKLYNKAEKKAGIYKDALGDAQKEIEQLRSFIEQKLGPLTIQKQVVLLQQDYLHYLKIRKDERLRILTQHDEIPEKLLAYIKSSEDQRIAE